MVTLQRAPGRRYQVTTGEVPLETVANQQRQLPDEFIKPSGNGMTQAFVDYAMPLLGDSLPEFERFD